MTVVYSPQHQPGEKKDATWARKVIMLLRKATENETLSFIKMRSLQRIQFIVLNQQKIWNWEAPNKKNSIDVRESKILIDATIPFQSLGDTRKEEPRWEGQYRASSAMQKNCIRRQGLLTYTWIITKIYHSMWPSRQWWHNLHLCKHVHHICDPCHGC